MINWRHAKGSAPAEKVDALPPWFGVLGANSLIVFVQTPVGKPSGATNECDPIVVRQPGNPNHQQEHEVDRFRQAFANSIP
jgi:hypothetical protein